MIKFALGLLYPPNAERDMWTACIDVTVKGENTWHDRIEMYGKGELKVRGLQQYVFDRLTGDT